MPSRSGKGNRGNRVGRSEPTAVRKLITNAQQKEVNKAVVEAAKRARRQGENVEKAVAKERAAIRKRLGLQ